jgi:sporulation protein YhbH
MPIRIEQDHKRFQDIIRGKIRKNLKEYISRGEILGKKGDKTVSIPIPSIDTPRFRFSDKSQGGVSQGTGDAGDPIGSDGTEKGDGGGKKAGKDSAEHAFETEVSIDELATMLGEELQLPNIENRGKKSIINDKDHYKGISRVGPESLRHFRRTYRQAMKRAIGMGTYTPGAPMSILPDDKRYRSWRTTPEPVANAVIVYMMDVSGSMGDEQKAIVRIETFWISAWLQKQYKGLEERFITHDANAREVTREEFFSTRESGGTCISSAYLKCADIIEADYPPSEWNIYALHFSDGDNWGNDDNELCIKTLRERILPAINMFGYGQVDSSSGSGMFISTLREPFVKDERVILSDIKGRDAIPGSIKEFLGRGR